MSSEIRNTILAVVEAWPAYHALKIVDGSHSTFKLVNEKLPAALEKVLPVDPKLIFEGSTGQGNITASPWIATFDRRVTTSATKGFYPVYLFSTDLKRLYLSIATGTTQFAEHYGDNKGARDKIEDAANTLSSIHSKKFSPSWQIGRIDLSAQSNHKLHRAYERSAITSIVYDVANLPQEETLVSDYQDMIRVYQEIVESPLTPDISDLLEESIEKPKVNDLEPTATAFVPRPKKKTKGGKGGGSSRHSKESKKIGDAGEKAVKLFEEKKLHNIGRDDLAGAIVWEADEGNKPGWDISSFDVSGAPIYIEVKSSKGTMISSVDVTDNEWKAAWAKGDRYKIYIVTKALSKTPTIEILENPVQYVEGEKLDFKPIIFRLSLTEK